ncbi:hypothetical protein PT277_02975 [Acetobacteraceae bacterium ESL0709]|nr:hypothetical protein [Acetobacteraceae bacterium ESL0697]MDF7677664.1 hypothetical protein [Acetobacteraceae bacterium ESL0709]
MVRQVWKQLVPSLIIIATAIFFSAPFAFPGQSELQTALILGEVWFWTLYEPMALPLLALFLCGLVVEVFRAGPPGVLLLWMLVTAGIANGARYRLSQGGFLRSWGAFSVTMMGGVALEWGFMCLRSGAFLSPLVALFQLSLTVGLYPCLYVFFLGMLRLLNHNKTL